jgi:hypothetical protein
MNEIVITGSTGVIGRRAVRELLAAGHRVTGVTRSARGRERLESLGAHAVEADVFDEASLRRAFDGAHAVVNLLTHVPSAVACRRHWRSPTGPCGPSLAPCGCTASTLSGHRPRRKPIRPHGDLDSCTAP